LTLSLARVLALSGGPLGEAGWPQRNLHTDVAKAREAGLGGIIASGTQSEGLLIGFLVELFGERWYAGAELDVRFLKPVSVNETVRPVVRLVTREVVDDRERIMLECWCETNAGERVIDGRATVTVPIIANEANAQ
jgi:acyl dehydratase